MDLTVPVSEESAIKSVPRHVVSDPVPIFHREPPIHLLSHDPQVVLGEFVPMSLHEAKLRSIPADLFNGVGEESALIIDSVEHHPQERPFGVLIVQRGFPQKLR